jgi:hypothetical protein
VYKIFAIFADQEKILHVSTEQLRFVTKVLARNASVLVRNNFQELKLNSKYVAKSLTKSYG